LETIPHAQEDSRGWHASGAAEVRKHLLPRWGKLNASSITRSDVKAMFAGIGAPQVANQTVRAASAVFSWAVREELVPVNPCLKIEHNETASRERVLADSEIAQFWAAFDSAGLLGSTALKLILLTGQRPGEVRHMRREHIVDGWWTLPGAPIAELNWPGTKNGNTHRVWLSKPAQQLLAELDGEGAVFPGTRGVIGESRLAAAMRSICRQLGAERATPHDLRRTNGTLITGLGFGRDAMNRIQNHVEGGIASVYDRHSYADENKRIMETVAQRIMTLVAGEAEGKVLPFGRIKVES
jgi:integrase